MPSRARLCVLSVTVTRSPKIQGERIPAEPRLPQPEPLMDITQFESTPSIAEIIADRKRRRRRTMPPELPAVRILIVDDDKAICEYMQTLLERDGFQVKALSDPTGVEEEVRHGGYHLIILDLMMPKLDGIEVLRRIRKLDTDIAVVIFTGFPNLESAVASMKLDAVDYIKKPFNVDEFREVISRVMRKKGLARTPEEQLHKVIGDTIRNLRKDKDLTLKQMSRRTGLSVSLLSQIERAESSASISSLYKIAIALESRIQDLFGEY